MTARPSTLAREDQVLAALRAYPGGLTADEIVTHITSHAHRPDLHPARAWVGQILGRFRAAGLVDFEPVGRYDPEHPERRVCPLPLCAALYRHGRARLWTASSPPVDMAAFEKAMSL